METEVKEQKSEVDVYEAALDVAVAELGDMPPRSNRVAANSIQGRSADGCTDLVARMRAAASRAQGPPVVREFPRLAGNQKRNGMETVTHTTKRFYLPEKIFDLSAMSLLNRRQAAAVRIIEWCPKFLLLPVIFKFAAHCI